MDFGDKLKTLREEHEMSREELAHKLAISYSTISKYETGARFPDQGMLIKIAKYFNVSTDYLLGISTIRNPYNSDSPELTEDEIITLAAHKAGHENNLSEEDMDKIKLAIKIALMKNGKSPKGD